MSKKKIISERQKRSEIYEREAYEEKNYLRKSYFALFRDDTTKGLLNFPTHEVTVGKDACLVYEIPQERMQEALDKANSLKGDIFFPVEYNDYKNAIILYFDEHNFIVRPTFFETGETGQGWGMDEDTYIKISSKK